MGDFNWITPQFLAFASPQFQPTAPISPSSPLYATLPTNLSSVATSNLPTPFKNVLSHFSSRNIGLVIRLNSELYSPSYFTALGIHHMDMIFEDGTCPPLPMVRKFIRLAHEMITVKNKGIAVHCKAGLGRTGCLIGAYLIYKHGFTANEIISFMRFMRPGMVVGPQQHWLHLNQRTFQEWSWEDTNKEKLAAMMPLTPTKASQKQRLVSNGQTATPPHGKRAALGEINHNNSTTEVAVMDENLPAPTPGQPRKTHRQDSRHHPYSRAASASYGIENQLEEKPETEVVSMSAHRQSQGGNESEEEWQLRMVARRTASRSPSSREKPRSVSQTTTTTTTTTYNLGENDAGIYEDAEEWTEQTSASRPKTPGSIKSGSGSGLIGMNKIRATPKRSADSRGESRGVRKTSGRMASTGTTAVSRAR
jgi:cell division cycle 14